MRVTDLLKKQMFLVRDTIRGGEASIKATDLLRMQHREAEMLFARILRSKDGRDQRALLNELADKLTAHMVIEQEIFYPAVTRETDQKDLVLESFEEHDVARYELERALATSASDDSFEARVNVLKELIQHHVQEEEDSLFKKVSRQLSGERLEQLGTRMRNRFDQLVARGHAAALRATTASEKPAPARANGSQRIAAKTSTGGTRRTKKSSTSAKTGKTAKAGKTAKTTRKAT